MKKLILVSLLAFSNLLFAKPLTSDQKILEFDQLLGQIRSFYGPLEYKQTHQNMDLKTVEALYRQQIQKSATNDEYYGLILKFVAEFKDSHFAARIPSKKRAQLPLGVDLIEGRVLVADVDTKELPEEKFPIKRGDELISIDGRPVKDVIQELMLRRGDGYHKTTERISAMYLTIRPASMFELPKGNASLIIKSKEKQTLSAFEIPWKTIGNDFENLSLRPFNNFNFSYDNHSIMMTLENDLGRAHLERSYMCSEKTRIKKPEGSIMISEGAFVAYYYPTPKGNVGYLRIPHYLPNRLPGITTEQGAFDQYEFAVSELEKNTVGLVIDQDHNCGGSVSYLHRLVSLFIFQPTEEMQFRLTANKDMLLSLQRMMDSMNPLTIAYKEAQALLNTVKTSYQAGDFLTPKTTITLNKYIYPNAVRYTKPIVMLIDELSGSGGDAFPAILQGIGRAVLIGTRTMGAGGHVTETPPLNFSQITISMTRSLFYRPDGIEVENNGAVPNIPYTITEDDFVNGYVGYRDFYTKKILELL